LQLTRKDQNQKGEIKERKKKREDWNICSVSIIMPEPPKDPGKKKGVKYRNNV